MPTRWLTLVAVALTAGCTPIIPMHFGETAEVIAKKEISLTVSGGGGSGSATPVSGGSANNVKDCCGGGAGRVRFGIGHNMEVGVEAEILGIGDTKGGDIILGGKVSYKYAPIPFLAILAGVGAVGTLGVNNNNKNGDAGLGADIGVVASTPVLAKILRIYGGARFSFVVPVRGDIYAGGGPTQAIVIPVGISLEPNPRWRVYAEGGYLGGWSENNYAVNGNAFGSINWNGGYAALNVAYIWRNP